MLLAEMVRSVEKIDGAIIECGVASGRSAQEIIDANRGRKKVILIDSFEGLPQPRDEDGKETKFKRGMYKEDYSVVVNKFADQPNVFVIKGWIPEVFKQIENEFFSFIHIDLDLYKPTIDALEFLMPKLQRNGILMIHDKSQLGVKMAIMEHLMKSEDYFMMVNSL